MMAVQRYRFVTDYRSGYGTYAPGQVIEVEPDVAEWINRDIPGCLEAVVETDPTKMSRDELNAYAAGRGVAEPENLASKAEVLAAIDATAAQPDEEEAETRAIDKPPADRQIKAATQKRGKEDPITTADFKATVDKG
jgi:hypothetical protein